MSNLTFGPSKLTIPELEQILKANVAGILYLHDPDIVVTTNLDELELGFWNIEVHMKRVPSLYHRHILPLIDLECAINPGSIVARLGGGIGKSMILHMIQVLEQEESKNARRS